MNRDTKRPDAYVREVTENTLAYVQELQREVSVLREKVAALELHKNRLEAQMGAQQPIAHEQYALIEQQNADLANLYVASYRLHETLERREVLAIIQEILANLVGSEDIGVYELSEDGLTLTALWSAGLDATKWKTLPARTGVIGRAIESREIYVGGSTPAPEALPHEATLTACVPLTLGSTIIGAITVFRLLDHKTELTRVDQELFELLATHAATALYCTGLHARVVASGAGATLSLGVG